MKRDTTQRSAHSPLHPPCPAATRVIMGDGLTSQLIVFRRISASGRDQSRPSRIIWLINFEKTLDLLVVLVHHQPERIYNHLPLVPISPSEFKLDLTALHYIPTLS